MLLIVIAQVCVLSVVDIYGHLIILDDAQLNTPCTEGLRSAMDSFQMNATIYGDFLHYVSSGWHFKVSAEILMENSVHFIEMCVIEIGENGELCGGANPGSCYCEMFDNDTGDVELMISHAAEMNISEGIVRLKWEHPSGNVTYSNNKTLPRVYDVHNVTLVLKVNGEPIKDSIHCSYTVVTKAFNHMELCCWNSATPCFPRVSVKQFTYPGNTSQCIKYEFVMHSGTFQSTMTKSYAVCSMDKFYTSGSCLAESRGDGKKKGGAQPKKDGDAEKQEKAPAAKGGEKAGKKGGVKNPDQFNYFILLIFVIPVVVIGYTSIKLIAIVFYSKRNVQAPVPDVPIYADRTSGAEYS